MRSIAKEMLKIYKPFSDLDWMNYKLIKKDITYHHILKKSDGGKMEINNGALLMPDSHAYLHLIESIDINVYTLLNELFKDINDQGCEPYLYQRYIIENILLEFESNHKWDKGYKGKLLIKRKYLERW